MAQKAYANGNASAPISLSSSSCPVETLTAKGEEHYGLEGHTAKARHYTLMYLPLVRLVEQSPAEGDEQNLRYHDSCEKHAQEEYRQDVDNPN